MIKKYRNKPVVIEALQYNGDIDNKEYSNFCHALVGDADGSIYIDTLEGDMLVNVGDFIIKGIHGEFYPCKPDIFKETYEEVIDWQGTPGLDDADAMLYDPSLDPDADD